MNSNRDSALEDACSSLIVKEAVRFREEGREERRW